MYILKKDNIEYIVATELEKDNLVLQGFSFLGKEDNKEEDNKDTINYDLMSIEELRTLAKEKGLEGYSRLKKADLINLLNE